MMKTLLVIIGVIGMIWIGGGSAWPLPLPKGPTPPVWPTAFITDFKELSFAQNVTKFGPGTQYEAYSSGVQYYDWSIKAERNDHIDWCFDFCMDCKCSFYMLGNLYFTQQPGNLCCNLLEDISAVPPDWVARSSRFVDYEGFFLLQFILFYFILFIYF